MDANSTLCMERRRSLAQVVARCAHEIENEALRESMTSFEHMEHRLEEFLVSDGVTFINDSRATNVNSAWYALETMRRPVIWIAGGQDKGNDYYQLRDLVKEKVKAIVCIGEYNRMIHGAFGGLVPTIIDASSMVEAVQRSYDLCEPGYAVLLSPACASFDRFENYEDRGSQFKRAARNLNSRRSMEELNEGRVHTPVPVPSMTGIIVPGKVSANKAA